jgi:hypothetical protein
MALNFDPNIGPVGGPGYVPPPTGEEETDLHDPTASTLSQSLAEALLVQLLPGWPVLQTPEDGNNYSIGSIAAVYATGTAEIINDMWDSYLDHLAEQKERIIDYLNSDDFRNWVAERTMAGQVHEQLGSNINTESVYNATDFNTYINTRIDSAINLWSNTYDGVINYINENRQDNPAAALFVATSFAITATYIGDYLNIVDVASTQMVTVNPVQDAIREIVPLIPQLIQEQAVLAINLFAIGLINFSNAEAIIRTGQDQQRPPTNWESVATFAHNVLEKVSGNMVNAFLMALLINNMEELGSTQEQREGTLNRLTVLAKAVMISVAVAALLKAATPDMMLNGLIFTRTMNEPLEARSDDDRRLVNELSPLVRYFNELRAEGMMSEEFWENLMEALGDFFDDNPDVEELVSPTVIYANLVKSLFNTEIEG